MRAQGRHSGGLGRTVTCAEEDVAGRGMPGHDAHPLGVALQHNHGLREGVLQSVLRDLPNLDHRKERGLEELTQAQENNSV